MMYVLAFNWRSGSNHLRRMMVNAGLGVCKEFFNKKNFNPGVYKKIIEKHQIVGLKNSWPSQKTFIADVGIDVATSIKYIYLTRDDELRQAISFVRSCATKQWTSNEEKKLPDPEYSYDRINNGLSKINHCEQQWDKFFDNDVEVLRVKYKDVGKDMVYQIAEYLELPVINEPTSSLKIQRDHLTEEWVRRFKVDLSVVNPNTLDSTFL